MPLVSPVTMQVRPVVVHVRLPGVEVAVYPVMGSPFGDDAAQPTVTDASPRVAVMVVGAVGTPAGVTAADDVDAGEFPDADLATTVTVYAVPLVRPVMAHVSAVVVEQLAPPGAAVAV